MSADRRKSLHAAILAGMAGMAVSGLGIHSPPTVTATASRNREDDRRTYIAAEEKRARKAAKRLALRRDA